MAGRAADCVAAMGITNGIVDDPIMRAEAPVARLMTLLETVMAEPGARVLLP